MNNAENLPPSLPRILLVEDEPTSAAFLAAAARAVPSEVDIAASVASALAMARERRYELWLLDATLPDGNGADLLARLQQVFPAVRAIAHTASDDPAQLAALARSGFDQVLRKPLPASELQAAVRQVLRLPAEPENSTVVAEPSPLWDDEAASNALNGNPDHIEALRGLFLAELPQAWQRIMEAGRTGQAEVAAAELHRLRASCGFVGATRLGQLVQALQRDPVDADVLADFDRTVRETLSQER